MARIPKPSGLKRKKTARAVEKSILIVCEGAITEPEYFENFIKRLDLRSVKIIGKECGTSPMCVVNRAKEIKDRLVKSGDGLDHNLPFDEIWCVFDKNGHANLKQAIDKAYGNNIKVALSNPCFEFWYVLHFEQTTRGYETCDRVIEELKTIIPNYRKNECPFHVLFDKTDTAIQNARYVREHGGGDPITNVDKLILVLRNARGY